MIKRHKTKTVKVGSAKIGSRYPVAIQSMTKTDTADITKTLKQIKALAFAGAHLIRIAVPTKHDTQAFAKLVERSPVPLIADIHFSPARAIEAIQAGAAKIRLNPGNIKNKKDIIRIIMHEREKLPKRTYNRLKVMDRHAVEIIKQIYEDGVKANVFFDHPSGLVALIILGACNSTMYWYRKTGKLKPEELAALTSEMIIRSISKNTRQA